VSALFAAVAMFIQDVSAVLLVQAEARNKAVLAAIFDSVMWLASIACTTTAVTILQGDHLSAKIMVLCAVELANVVGCVVGVKLGKRYIKEDKNPSSTREPASSGGMSTDPVDKEEKTLAEICYTIYMSVCSLCGKPVMARGWCSKHYSTWNRHGDPLWEPTIYERYWSKVRVTEDCWEWTAGKSDTGYGVFAITRPDKGHTSVGAHQFSYWVCVGEVPGGWEIDHLCRNRGCVRPEHLEAVPHRVNMERSSSPIMGNRFKTHCPQGHPYSGDNLMVKHNSRYCRICERRRWRDWDRRRREETSLASPPACE
jgi:hypothetical protein